MAKLDTAKLLIGGAVLDAPSHVPAIWGTGDAVLWSEGEPRAFGDGSTSPAPDLLVGLRSPHQATES